MAVSNYESVALPLSYIGAKPKSYYGQFFGGGKTKFVPLLCPCIVRRRLILRRSMPRGARNVLRT
jgi:hypothetical protein